MIFEIKKEGNSQEIFIRRETHCFWEEEGILDEKRVTILIAPCLLSGTVFTFALFINDVSYDVN